ncbi:hypothetical protein G2W53_043023 [Senna tora]|uniref:Uncharacterized protein n=1 Tax=Senna tora TaxID=362788 RepID=A0A834SNC4_9FABA|nr:hypothetical protein G2W53_043023 [Senna tora]
MIVNSSARILPPTRPARAIGIKISHFPSSSINVQGIFIFVTLASTTLISSIMNEEGHNSTLPTMPAHTIASSSSSCSEPSSQFFLLLDATFWSQKDLKNAAFAFESRAFKFKRETMRLPTYSRNSNAKADIVIPTVNFFALNAKTITANTFKTAATTMFGYDPPTHSPTRSMTRPGAATVTASASSSFSRTVSLTNGLTLAASVFDSCKKSFEFESSGGGDGGGAGGTGGGSGRFLVEELRFLKRLRFLTKRSMREVGKPVSTTREPPRFGD